MSCVSRGREWEHLTCRTDVTGGTARVERKRVGVVHYRRTPTSTLARTWPGVLHVPRAREVGYCTSLLKMRSLEVDSQGVWYRSVNFWRENKQSTLLRQRYVSIKVVRTFNLVPSRERDPQSLVLKDPQPTEWHGYLFHLVHVWDEKNLLLNRAEPMSREYGTNKRVKARFWPWLSGKSH